MGTLVALSKCFCIVFVVLVAAFLSAFGSPLFDAFFTDYQQGVSPPFSTCESIFSDAIGAEDAVVVSHQPGIVLLSSAPRITVMDAKIGNGAIYKFNTEDRTITLVPLIGYPSDTFHPHGISLYKNEQDRTFLFVTNHQHKGMADQVTIFEFKNDELHHIITHEDEKFVSINDVAAWDESSFFVTNDNGYPRGHVMHFISLAFPLFSKSSVVFFDGSQSHFIAPPGQFSFANGVAVSTSQKRLYVSNSSPGSLEIFALDTQEPKKSLPIKSLFLGTGIDNLTFDHRDGLLYTACHPNPILFLRHMIKKGNNHAPSQALRLVTDDLDNIQVDVIFLSDGSDVSASSAAMRVGKYLLITPVLQNYFALCKS